MRNKIIFAALADVGVAAYLWGGNGEYASSIGDLRSYVTRKETADSSHTKEQNVERVLNFVSKLQAKGISNIPLQDCSGAVIKWHKMGGCTIKDRTAASLYSGSTKVARETIQPGDMCFHHNGTKISHVGLYVGNGKVIESIGRDSGTVQTNFNREKDGKLYWTHFGYWPSLGTSIVEKEEKVAAPVAPTTKKQGVPKIPQASNVGIPYVLALKNVRIRKEPSTKGASLGYIANGTKVTYGDTDPDTGWHSVETAVGFGFVSGDPSFTKVVM